jgi:hypothetical protein
VIARKVSRCTMNARDTRVFAAWTIEHGTWCRTLSGEALLNVMVRRADPFTTEPVWAGAKALVSYRSS